MPSCGLIERKDIKAKVITALRSTVQNKKEYGFPICIDEKGRDIVSGIIEGGYSEGVSTECPKFYNEIGAFHTHVILTSKDDIVPSPADIIKNKIKFFCIGGIKKDGRAIVRCFDRDGLVRQANQKTSGINDIVKKMVEDTEYLERNSCKKYVM